MATSTAMTATGNTSTTITTATSTSWICALLPVRSLDPTDLAAARDTAVKVFSDWENPVKPGETVTPGTTLQRLKLLRGTAISR